MDMDEKYLKTVFYILMAITWLYFKFKKKNTGPDKTSDQSSNPENAPKKEKEQDVITMLENLLGEKQKKEVTNPPDYIRDDIKQQKKNHKKDDNLFHKVKTDDLHRPERKKESFVGGIVHEENIEPDEILTDLDPRKMIIYNEIMRRPVY